DLKATQLDGAVLRGADLTGCDFTGAFLRGATIQGCSLEDVLFHGADLQDVTIEEITSIDDVAVSPNGDRYAAAAFDGTMIIGSMQTGAELLRIRTGMAEAHALAWSSDGQYLVGGGGGKIEGDLGSVSPQGWLGMWNSQDGTEIFFIPGAHRHWVAYAA